MPLTLKGRFDVEEFIRDWNQSKGTIYGCIPMMPYILGEGETLEGVFDELVTIPALKRSDAVKKIYRMFSGKRNGYLVAKFDVAWIEYNWDLPPKVRLAIRKVQAEAKKEPFL